MTHRIIVSPQPINGSIMPNAVESIIWSDIDIIFHRILDQSFGSLFLIILPSAVHSGLRTPLIGNCKLSGNDLIHCWYCRQRSMCLISLGSVNIYDVTVINVCDILSLFHGIVRLSPTTTSVT